MSAAPAAAAAALEPAPPADAGAGREADAGATDDDVIIGEGALHDFGLQEDTNRRGAKAALERPPPAAALRDSTNVGAQQQQRAAPPPPPPPRYPKAAAEEPPRERREPVRVPLQAAAAGADGPDAAPSLVRSSIDAGEVARMSLAGGRRSLQQAGGHGHRMLAARPGGAGSHARNRSALSDAHTEIDKLLRGMQGELVSWRESYEALRGMWVARFDASAPPDAADAADAADALIKPPAGVDGFADFIGILEEYLEQTDGARAALDAELGQAMDELDATRGELVDARDAEREERQRARAAQEELDAAFERREELHQGLERAEEDLRASRAKCLALEDRAGARDAEFRARLEASCAELNAQLLAAREEARRAVDAMGEKEVAVLHKDGTIESLRAELKRTAAALNVQDERVKIQEAELAQRESAIKEMDHAMAEARLEAGGLAGERSAAREEAARLRGDLKLSQAALAEAEDARAAAGAEAEALRQDLAALRASEDARRASSEQNASLLAEQRRASAALEAKLRDAGEALRAAGRRHADDLRAAEEEAAARAAQAAERLAGEHALRKANEDSLRLRYEEKLEGLRRAHDEELEEMGRRGNQAREALVDDSRVRERDLHAALREARAESERGAHEAVTLRDALQNAELSLGDLKRRVQEEQARADAAGAESIALRGQLHKSNEQLRRQAAAHRRAMAEARRDFSVGIESATAKIKAGLHGRIDSIVDGNFRALMAAEPEDAFAPPPPAAHLGGPQLAEQQYLLRGDDRDGDGPAAGGGHGPGDRGLPAQYAALADNDASAPGSDVELEEISLGDRRDAFAGARAADGGGGLGVDGDDAADTSESNVIMGSPYFQG